MGFILNISNLFNTSPIKMIDSDSFIFSETISKLFLFLLAKSFSKEESIINEKITDSPLKWLKKLFFLKN